MQKFMFSVCQLKLSNLHHLCNARRGKKSRLDLISSQQVSTSCCGEKKWSKYYWIYGWIITAESEEKYSSRK